MAKYIKANPKVAQFLHVENDRNQVKDGNYLLWQGDMTVFGPLTMLSDTLKQIGGLALMPHEAREEQDGTILRPLPVAEDPRFVIDEPEPEPEPETEQVNEATDEQPQDETEGDSAESEEPETDND